MRLVPIEEASGGPGLESTGPGVAGYATVNVPAHKQQYIGVKIAPVERRTLVGGLKAVGRVDYDETGLSWVNTKIAGWIEVLHVDRVGQVVRAGQPLLDIYSPELLATQEEYLLARDHLARLQDGRRDREARDRIMHQFRNGRIDVLVATSVIEVGVDVPNATIMIVEHADRFGLSQLHQLRGRVGRSTKRSLCTFIADPKTPGAEARMEAIGSTTDGFVIAEKDFEIRGMGEIFGTRQAGVAPFRVTELPRDIELLRMARRDARAWIDDDPHLRKAGNAAIRALLMQTYGDRLGLADVG
jgi:hypothetical protein